MGSSFSRIADEQIEGIPEPLVPFEIDNDIVDKLKDLVRAAHEQSLVSRAARAGLRSLIYKWLRAMTTGLVSLSPTQEQTPAILARALLYEKLQHILAVPSTWGHVVSLGTNDAGVVLNLLQEWLDSTPVDHPDRRRAIYLLVKLSSGSKQLPRLLYVSNVQIIGNRDPWNGGGFADVFKATHNNTHVVLKRLRVYRTQESHSDLDQCFRQEALIWRQLKHPFILPMIGIDANTFAETHRLPCLVSPLMRRGTLKEYIHSEDYAPMRDFYRLLEEAAQGLAYLHMQKVVHGDIKDVNVLISEECHIQLCDFGLVVVGNSTDGRLPTANTARGTGTWMSPQRMDGDHYRRTEADDVYALACLCYYISTKHAPFHNLSQPAAIRRVMDAQRPARPEEGNECRTLVTDALWALVESCWAHDASIRPTAAAVASQLAAMGHVSVTAALGSVRQDSVGSSSCELPAKTTFGTLSTFGTPSVPLRSRAPIHGARNSAGHRNLPNRPLPKVHEPDFRSTTGGPLDRRPPKSRVFDARKTSIKALALASLNVGCIAQNLKLNGEDRRIAQNPRSYGEEERLEAPASNRSPLPRSPVFEARKILRAAVFAIIAIERMSRLLDYRDWLSQEEVFEHEHSPDASRTAKHPLPATEDLPERDISLSAHEYALSMGLIRRLEDLIGEGVAVQTALDNLDRALLKSDPSHPAYRQGVRRLRRWCRKFALLPTSSKSISSRAILLESEQPRFTTQISDVFCGLYDGTSVAVKVLRVYNSKYSLADDQKSFRNEVAHWRYLRHPNIVPFVGVCDKSFLCVVSHWMVEGTLLEFFHRHPNQRRTSYILDAIRGLAFMHSLGVIHGDIKAVNIFVDREHRARLADFGLVSVLNKHTTAAIIGGDNGTVRYMAPELYLDIAVRTDRSDIYALSITIWEMFTLKIPYSHIRDNITLPMRVMKDERPTRPVNCENIGFTEDLWGLMQGGWSAKLESRPSLSAFIKVLESQD